MVYLWYLEATALPTEPQLYCSLFCQWLGSIRPQIFKRYFVNSNATASGKVQLKELISSIIYHQTDQRLFFEKELFDNLWWWRASLSSSVEAKKRRRRNVSFVSLSNHFFVSLSRSEKNSFKRGRGVLIFKTLIEGTWVGTMWPDLAPFWQVIGHFWSFQIVFGKLLHLHWQIFHATETFSLLQMAKNWTINVAIWSHWGVGVAQGGGNLK